MSGRASIVSIRPWNRRQLHPYQGRPIVSLQLALDSQYYTLDETRKLFAWEFQGFRGDSLGKLYDDSFPLLALHGGALRLSFAPPHRAHRGRKLPALLTWVFQRTPWRS